MATTTNYGWTTPDDTALVKDGAAAIRTLGSSVDTTTKNLNPSTTLGDIEYRSSTANTNTRLGIGSSGQVLTVAAGVPSWATPTDQTPLTTKGDLFTFSTVDARLGVGANGTILVADSSEATGIKWAAPASGGGMTLLSTTTLSGTSTTLSSISQSYTDLYFVLTNCSVDNIDAFKIRPNNDSGTNQYLFSYVETNDASLTTQYSNGANYGFFAVTPIITTQRMKLNGTGRIPRYTSSETKIIQSTTVLGYANSTTHMFTGSNNYTSSSAITSITFVHDTIVSGTLYMYGVN